MLRTPRLRHLAGPVLALSTALVAGTTPAAASIFEQTGRFGLTLTAGGTASGTLTCTGTLTGLGGGGVGSVDDGGLFYDGLVSATGETCANADGTGTLQLSISGSNMFGGQLDCQDLTGGYVNLAGIVVTTLQGTCAVDGVQFLEPMTLTTTGVFSPTGTAVVTMVMDDVHPA